MSQPTADNGVNMRLAYIALICGGTIGALSFGIRTGFGLFLEPITADLGTGRSVRVLAGAPESDLGRRSPSSARLRTAMGPTRPSWPAPCSTWSGPP